MERRNAHSHRIDLGTARGLTKKFRDNRKNLLDSKFKEKDKQILPTCETFDRAAFDELLQQPGCTKVRIYLAQGQDDELRLVIVGVDAAGRDMIGSATAGTTAAATETLRTATIENTEPGVIIENGTRCPDDCPEDSDLNT